MRLSMKKYFIALLLVLVVSVGILSFLHDQGDHVAHSDSMNLGDKDSFVAGTTLMNEANTNVSALVSAPQQTSKALPESSSQATLQIEQHSLIESFAKESHLKGYFDKKDIINIFSSPDFNEMMMYLPNQQSDDIQMIFTLEKKLLDAALEAEGGVELVKINCASQLCMIALAYNSADDMTKVLNKSVLAEPKIKSIISQPVSQSGHDYMRIVLSYSDKVNSIQL